MSSTDEMITLINHRFGRNIHININPHQASWARDEWPTTAEYIDAWHAAHDDVFMKTIPMVKEDRELAVLWNSLVTISLESSSLVQGDIRADMTYCFASFDVNTALTRVLEWGRRDHTR